MLSLTIFLLIASLKPELTPTDTAVNTWSTSIHAGSITTIATAISVLFDTTVLLPLTLLIAIILLLKRHRNCAILLPGAMAGVTLIVDAVKALIHSPRPTNSIIAASGFSFPSGHVTSTIVFFGILTYLAWQHWKNSKTKTLTGILYIAIEALVGFSRVYLNAHWLSDILGGYTLGTFWFTLSIFILQYLEKTRRLEN